MFCYKFFKINPVWRNSSENLESFAHHVTTEPNGPFYDCNMTWRVSHISIFCLQKFHNRSFKNKNLFTIADLRNICSFRWTTFIYKCAQYVLRIYFSETIKKRPGNWKRNPKHFTSIIVFSEVEVHKNLARAFNERKRMVWAKGILMLKTWQ